MSMRFPKLTDFAAMCVELIPLPEPKDIVVRKTRKALSIAAQQRQAAAANETKRRSKRDREERSAKAKQAAEASAAKFLQRDKDRGKY